MSLRDTNEFAERIGITQAHLSGVENNKDNPSDS
ncbi:MAG: helix-turn-helix transcriptional regulator, partial [Clostridiales bacterium]|nr:helix-turn-helix transcriptional regulator [Clostridiales bacterium]